MTDPAAQAAALRREINRHNYLYYVEDAPFVSDAEFDALVAALKAVEAAHPELVTTLLEVRQRGRGHRGHGGYGRHHPQRR